MACVATVTVVAAALVSTLAGSATASNPHTQRFTVVAHNDEGSITPADFFGALDQNDQASVDAPVYLDGDEVGVAETILTVTRGGADAIVMIECSVELTDGAVLFNGSFHVAELGDGVSVPVVGGTSRYAGARGVVVMTVTDPARPVLAFDFTTK